MEKTYEQMKSIYEKRFIEAIKDQHISKIKRIVDAVEEIAWGE